MTKKLPLTLACGDYEILRPLKEGTVAPDGIELNVLTASDSTTRHWRFLRNREYDIAECSASSYIVARDRDLPFRAIPVFPHRRFRHGFIFINTGKNITKPKDLIGKKVGVKSYQVTAVLWLRGMLEEHYGVPHKSIEWFAELDEDVPFTPPDGLVLHRLPDTKSVETMLAEGEIDALLHPDIIDPILNKDPRVGRLFPDYKAEELSYYKQTGIFPIMHVLGIRRSLADAHPWLPFAVFKAFERSKAIALARLEDASAAKVTLPFIEEQLHDARALMGDDFWSYGLQPNRLVLERFLRQHHEEGLSARRLLPEELFHPATVEAHQI
jgi:4,5-dihydroxyphthalate decarboxylase